MKPVVVNGRITKEFMDSISYPEYRNGNAFVSLHFSLAQKKELGIKDTLFGNNNVDTDFVLENYFFADENTKRKGRNRFVETCLHELSHGLARGTEVEDMTHAEDAKKGTVVDLFPKYNFKNYQVEEQKLTWQISILKYVLNLLKPQTPNKLTGKVQRMADQLVADMKMLGYEVMVYQGFRSIEEQFYLYEQGRTRVGPIITNAKGGDSFHNYGVAVDIVFVKDGKPSWAESHPWATLGKVGKKLGFEWGGDWKDFVDRPHFQLTLGYTLEDFKNKKVDYLKFV